MKRKVKASRTVYWCKPVFAICLQLSLTVRLGEVQAIAQTTLPGTAPLTVEGDIADQMVEGIKRYLLRETDASIDKRARLWKRDYGSVESYNQSVAPNRERFRQDHWGGRRARRQSRAAAGGDPFNPGANLDR